MRLGLQAEIAAQTLRWRLWTPVAFGGVVFVPGDMLYADEDGVAVLPTADEDDE